MLLRVRVRVRVIYVSPVHPNIPKGLVVFYVDEFVVTVASSSHRRNVQLLLGHYRSLRRIAPTKRLSLSVTKTELNQWRTLPERSPPSVAGVTLNHLGFPPENEVRWLGYWSTPALLTNAHFA